MGKARTVNIPHPQEHSGLAFSAAALSHNGQTSEEISPCFEAQTGCVSLLENLRPAHKNREQNVALSQLLLQEKVGCISLKARKNQRWKSCFFLRSDGNGPQGSNRDQTGDSSLVFCPHYSCSEVETNMYCMIFFHFFCLQRVNRVYGLILHFSC